MNTLYLITKILTYPGAFLKGFWEHVTCRILKLQVTDRSYLRADSRCGHAGHAPALSPAKAFWLSFLPYIPQRILGWIFVIASAAPLLLFNMRSREENPLLIIQAIALFLGVSLLCNSFPRWEDAKQQWRLFYGKPTPEEEQTAQEYSEALFAALEAKEAHSEAGDAEDAIEGDSEPEPEDNAEAEDAAEDNTDAEPEAEEDAPTEEDLPADEFALPEMPALPRFAGLAGKIILAPCNAYFLAGAWLERSGLPVILSIAAIVAALLLR